MTDFRAFYVNRYGDSTVGFKLALMAARHHCIIGRVTFKETYPVPASWQRIRFPLLRDTVWNEPSKETIP